jgi:hypothetical protein
MNFSQYEVEGKINDILAFGDETRIAEKLGRSTTLVSQQCNPHDERESDFYKAIKFVCAELEVDQCRGLELLQLFNLMCERHVTEDSKRCAVKEASVFISEFSEAMQAQVENKADSEKIKEIDDVIRQAKILKYAILNEQEKEEISTGNGFKANGKHSRMN